MKTSSPTTLTLSALIIAAFGFAGDAAMAGKGGNGNGNGGSNGGNGNGNGGSSSSVSSQSRSVKATQSGSQGALASDLKKANGAIHASNTAWANASANGVPGIARTYAEAQAGIDSLGGDLEQLQLDKAALEGMTSYEDYQAQIDALKVEDFVSQQAYDDEVLALEGLRDDPATLTDAQIATEIGLIDDQIAEIEGFEQDMDDALASLVGDRELSPEAMAELEQRVEDYLASDAYQSTVETTAEELPVE